MPSLCDINVLLAICHADHSHHDTALHWLDGVEAASGIAVCRVSQIGLLRLLNNPAVMLGQARDVKAAWHDYDIMMSDERFVFVNEPYSLEDTLRRIMRSSLISPRLWQDAYLAAFAIAAGIQFVSFDRGFRQFGNLDLLLLGDAGA
ncbi:MAG: PIN domain-containing protein [Chloroflexi bacterium]|nr:PIN domain-containing protein [Chloroflexota bacterium]MCL5275330.1 PIN domain-containing protein [Chloroflexota bacterium]